MRGVIDGDHLPAIFITPNFRTMHIPIVPGYCRKMFSLQSTAQTSRRRRMQCVASRALIPDRRGRGAEALTSGVAGYDGVIPRRR